MFDEKHTTLRDHWQSFRVDVLEHAPEMQVHEMQKAFYAGASCLLTIMTQKAGATGILFLHNKDEAEIFRELIDFVDDLREEEENDESDES